MAITGFPPVLIIDFLQVIELCNAYSTFKWNSVDKNDQAYLDDRIVMGTNFEERLYNLIPAELLITQYKK